MGEDMARSIWDILDELEEASDELLEDTIEEMREELRRVIKQSTPHVYGTYEACPAQEPAYSVNEMDDEYRVVVDLPYVDPNKISLKLSGRTLILRALTQREINGRCVSFEAKIQLQKPVDKNQSSAHFARGLLVVRLKKQKGVNIGVV